MDYRDQIAEFFSEDPEVLDDIIATLASEAADRFRDALGWIVCYGDKRGKPAARAAALGYLMGYLTLNEAAKMGKCNRRTITKLKVSLCETMGISKVYTAPIRRADDEKQ